MMKRLRRYISVLAICAMVLPMLNFADVSADESVNCEVENGVYSISGSLKGNYANVITMPADDSVETITAEKLSQPNYISFSAPNKNGKFSKSFALPQDFENGEYKSVIWDGADSKEAYFINGDETFKNELIKQKINDDKLTEVVERYSQAYGIDKEAYANLKESVKLSAAESLKNTEINDFAAQYKESIANASFANIDSTDDVYNLLVLLDTDFTYYNKLSNDEKEAVLLRILKNLPSAASGMKDLAEKYSKEAYQDKNSSGGSSSGGSSSGGSALGPDSGSSMIKYGNDKGNSGVNLPNASAAVSDIAEHWAKDSITELMKKGIVSGSDDGKFYPDNNVSRGEFAKMLAKASGMVKDNANMVEFTDVQSSEWYYEPIMILSSNGIINGYEDGTFRPDNQITREEMAVIVYRALEKFGISFTDESDFSDFDKVSSYAKEAVKKLSGVGVITGSNGEFRPDSNLTRAEAAVVALRTYTKIAANSTTNAEETADDAAVVKKEYTKAEVSRIEAEDLFSRLVNHTMRGITRAEFMADVFELTNQGTAKPAEQYYEDLPLSREETPYIQAAADMGYISKDGNFRPDDIITKTEAAQIMVCVLGYAQYAEANGGWPIGYIRSAEKAELFKNVSQTSGAMDENSAAIMLLNMLNSRVLTVKSLDISTKNMALSDIAASDKTLLEKAFGLHRQSGIVRETKLNSLKKTGINKQDIVVVDDESYIAKNDDEDYTDFLGFNVNIYYNDDNEVFMIAKNDKNKAVIFSADGSEVQDNTTVTYTDSNNKKHKYKLTNTYSFIYNGALSKRTPKQVLSLSEDSEVTLLDNNNDGIYDIVMITKPEYLLVDSVSKTNRLIYDKNSADNVIDLSDNETMFHISGRNGKQIRLVDVSAEDVYELYTTEDKKLVNLALADNIISGTVKALKNSDEVIIDAETYKVTDYFKKYYSEILKIGANYTFVLSPSGKLISFSEPRSEFLYGYVTNVSLTKDAIDDSIYLKLFSEDGKFYTYTIDKKLTVDGKKFKPVEILNKLSSETQLIKYKTDESGQISAIDTAEVSDGNSAPGTKKKDGDSLTEYKFADSTYYFKENVDLMYPYFNVSGTMVFAIPNDISDKTKFRITNSAYFADGQNYSNLKVYDVQESGTAGAVVVRSSDTTPAISKYVSSFIVEEISNELYSDNEVLRHISGWMDNKYLSYYIDEDVSIRKASGEEIGFGDVIRFYAENDVIKAIICDFDANDEVFMRNDETSAGDFNQGNKDVGYQLGRVYSVNDGFIYMGSGENGDDMTVSGLRNFSANTSNIAVIDKKTKEVRTGTLADIKTYKNYGKGDIVLLKQRNLLSMAIYIYKDGEE